MTVLALHTDAPASHPAASSMPVRKAIPAGQLLIGGRWMDAEAGETMEVTDPTTGALETIPSIEQSGLISAPIERPVLSSGDAAGRPGHG